MAYAYNGARVSGQTRMRGNVIAELQIRREGEGTVVSGKQIFGGGEFLTDSVISG